MPFYLRARDNAMKIGKELGRTLVKDLLINKLNQDSKLIHAIGHSLGAHLVGHIGKQNSHTKIGRITGLDPAKPQIDESDRIAKTDAEVVDVIHTNGGDFFDGCLGIPDSIGHVDFYPNGGEHMTGCTDSKPSRWNIVNKVKDLIRMVKGCSHNRALRYYADSIQNDKNNNYFEAKKCLSFDQFKGNSCGNAVTLTMGEWMDIEK